MAKTRPPKRSKNRSMRKEKKLLHSVQSPRDPGKHFIKSIESPSTLLAQASSLLQTSSPDLALPIALRALALLEGTFSTTSEATLPALSLLGEIHIELGSVEEARAYFLRAIKIDPNGTIPISEGGGAEKFLWLAQLCEEGGEESVKWFEKGVHALKADIEHLESARAGDVSRSNDSRLVTLLDEKRRKAAGALCGAVEVWMTDLSFSPHAESACEALITEALLLSPSDPTPLQTLASIRLSQSRLSDAQAALQRSMALWTLSNSSPGPLKATTPPEIPESQIPDFPTRISLARLLMEAEMAEAGMEVLDGLVAEDDQSVEAWYLGGWCLYLLAQQKKTGAPILNSSNGHFDRKERMDTKDGGMVALPEEEILSSLLTSREWLRRSLGLYDMLEYEDERLRDHARELVSGMDDDLVDIEDQEGDEGGEWEDEGDSGNEDDDDDDDSNDEDENEGQPEFKDHIMTET